MLTHLLCGSQGSSCTSRAPFQISRTAAQASPRLRGSGEPVPSPRLAGLSRPQRRSTPPCYQRGNRSMWQQYHHHHHLCGTTSYHAIYTSASTYKVSPVMAVVVEHSRIEPRVLPVPIHLAQTADSFRGDRRPVHQEGAALTHTPLDSRL